jgi:ankyrin repeat protein
MPDSRAEKEFVRAVKHGAAETVAAMLSADPALARIEDADDGSTPLHHAAWKGHAEVAALLLDAGADVNAQNRNTHYGGTPLHQAAHGNQKAVVELLLARGADVNAVSANGRTPLQETEFHKATAAAKLLRAAGA